MIITKKYALKLIKAGKATVETSLKPDSCGSKYVAISRTDVQRTDHYINN